ncbi:DUF1835 domain-containing protein [Aquirufa lenticrescens]|uniref:DUF1835 domain-containing protein n=1 Tax=Aquirufa lenticrescens TaxID=2696560 RepID=UPI001CAA74DD|nr:DUF1835 domain-containing protein [Aquirufa lenticrescens]UAJ14149.1 DUF1835 domain-containing protein [Aquirufa lenticrescens]
MKVHILNGDCLQSTLQAENPIIMREMLIEGPLGAASLEAFFRQRALYLEKTYTISQEEYAQKTVTEIEKMQQIPDHSEVNLWFDYDLFCFVNLLFIIQLLSQNKTLKLFLVRPLREPRFRIWRGFDGHSQTELKQAFSQRKKIGSSDLHFMYFLWNRLGKKNGLPDHVLLPFLSKHLNDYGSWQNSSVVRSRWGLTGEQAARIEK